MLCLESLVSLVISIPTDSYNLFAFSFVELLEPQEEGFMETSQLGLGIPRVF